MLRVLHLHDAPWVEAASDLLAFGFDQLVGPDHRERDAGLQRDSQARRTPRRDPLLTAHARGTWLLTTKFTRKATGTHSACLQSGSSLPCGTNCLEETTCEEISDPYGDNKVQMYLKQRFYCKQTYPDTF